MRQESIGWADGYPNFWHPHWVFKPRTRMRTQPTSQRTKVMCPGMWSWHLLKPWWKLEGMRFNIDWALEFPVEKPKQTIFSGKSSIFEVTDSRSTSKMQTAPISFMLGRTMGIWVGPPPRVLKVECFKSWDHSMLCVAVGNSFIVRDGKDKTWAAFTRSSLERGWELH